MMQGHKISTCHWALYIYPAATTSKHEMKASAAIFIVHKIVEALIIITIWT